MQQASKRMQSISVEVVWNCDRIITFDMLWDNSRSGNYRLIELKSKTKTLARTVTRAIRVCESLDPCLRHE